MHSIKLRSHVGSDGILQLQVPVGLKDTDLEIMVIIHPLETQAKTTPEEQGWSPGFFEEVIGGWEGEPLTRSEQGHYEMRDELR